VEKVGRKEGRQAGRQGNGRIKREREEKGGKEGVTLKLEVSGYRCCCTGGKFRGRMYGEVIIGRQGGRTQVLLVRPKIDAIGWVKR
jgi:hypothetical protein